MKRLLLFLFLYVFILFRAGSQVNKYGIPFITNYSPGEYNAGEQNWATIQDNRGVMYFGNNDNGVLEYDGETWRQIPVPNNSAVRSLAIDKAGTVYVGAISEFGYLAPDESGNLNYISLSNQLDSLQSQSGRIDKIYFIGNRTYFSNVQKIFYYRNKQFKEVYERTIGGFMGFKYNSDIYLGNYKDGIKMLQDSIIVPVKGGDYYKEKNVFVMLPYKANDEVLIGAVDAQGEADVTVYSTNTGNVKENFLSAYASEILKESVIYGGVSLHDNKFAFATLYNGLIILNNKGEVSDWYNKKNGLYNETVLNVYINYQQGPLWLPLNIGIAKVELNNHFRKFSEESGFNGTILDIIEFNNRLYIATSSGVYFLDYINQTPRFFKVENIKNQSWTFLNYKTSKENKLLVGTILGIYEIMDNKAINIEEQFKGFPEELKYYTYKLVQSKKDESSIYVGTNYGLAFVSYKNGKWNSREKFYGEDEIKSIDEDHNGNIWLGTTFNGLIRVTINEKDTNIQLYNKGEMLPSLRDIQVLLFNNIMIFGTEQGIYKFNYEKNVFEPDNQFPLEYTNGEVGILKFSPDFKGNLWISAQNEGGMNKWVDKLNYVDNQFVSEKIPFKRLSNEQPEVIYHSADSITWIGISNVLYSYNKNFKKDFESKYYSLIRKVVYQEDSIVFNGANYIENNDGDFEVSYKQPESLKPILKHQNNALNFFYAALYFENENATQYSYMLEGYNNKWSKWSEKAEKGYTNLNQGKYTFKVKAKNVYDVESEIASFEFTILPPWYQTIIAYIGYIIVAFLIIYTIVKLYTRRLEQEKIRLEGIVRERTAEVVAQKDEIEEQRDQIQEQKQGMEDSIHYASRIQRALLPGEILRGNLPDHFILFKPRDIVSGDFYWMANVKGKIFIVAADCTGHGVPGAFMSMLGMSFLNEIVVKGEEIKAKEILNQLRDNIISALKQTGKLDEAKDGMDLALLIWDRKTNTVEFAGANNPLYYIRLLNEEELKMLEKEDESFIEKGAMHNGKYVLNQVKADKMPIGIYVKADIPFSDHILKVEKGYALYTFSDGYVDQFGGETGKKFMIKRFKKMLLEIQENSMEEQKEILDKAIEDWKGSKEQVDDILVFGVKM